MDAALDERREKIFDTACFLLEKNGYTHMSMSKLACEAGMSKKTLYQIFENKELLLNELMQERLFRPMQFHRLPEALPLEKQLLDFMLQIHRHYIHPQNLALLRLLIGEIERSPIIAKNLSGLIHLSDRESPIKTWLIAKKEAGILQFEDLEDTASRLFGLVLGSPFIEHLLECTLAKQNEEWMRQYAAEGIRIFLAAYQT